MQVALKTIFGAHSKMVLRIHGMDGVRVRFPVGPPKNASTKQKRFLDQKMNYPMTNRGVSNIKISVITNLTPCHSRVKRESRTKKLDSLVKPENDIG